MSRRQRQSGHSTASGGGGGWRVQERRRGRQGVMGRQDREEAGGDGQAG